LFLNPSQDTPVSNANEGGGLEIAVDSVGNDESLLIIRLFSSCRRHQTDQRTSRVSVAGAVGGNDAAGTGHVGREPLQ